MLVTSSFVYICSSNYTTLKNAQLLYPYSGSFLLCNLLLLFV